MGSILAFMTNSPFLTIFLTVIVCTAVEAWIATAKGREPAFIRWWNL